MKNTERRVLAEVETTGHLWDPHSLSLELDMDPRDLPPELNLDSSDLPPNSNPSDAPPPEPYWDSRSFEIVLEAGLNPLFQPNEQTLDENNNRHEVMNI